MNTDFLEALASKEPVPGGGAACAYVGALGSALNSMVGNLTVGKPKYADVEDQMIECLDSLAGLRQRLVELIEEDKTAFAPVIAAYALPKESNEEKAARTQAVQQALVGACKVPLDIMRCCASVIEQSKFMAENGSKMVLSDAGVGVIFASAALKAASLNVYINTGLMSDKQMAQEFNEQADNLVNAYSAMADEIAAFVRQNI